MRAASYFKALTSALMLAGQQAWADYIQFELEDTDAQPMGFKDGLDLYITVTNAVDETEFDKKFLLCTSCTISFIIGDVPEGVTPTTVNMAFISGGEKNVPVNFVPMSMSIMAEVDTVETKYAWDMNIGYIAESYVLEGTYGIDFDQNMLGLAPMTVTGDATIDQRQFLRQFVVAAGTQDSKTYELSYAFNADEMLYIGGSAEDYQAFTCDPEDDDECDEDDPDESFDNEGATQDGAIPTGASDLNFADPLSYSKMDLMLKIQNYVPPMKEELENQVLAVDTWYRETQLPEFFYDYFTDTFMIQAYTCDELNKADDVQYPGLSTTYSCYCNNGDYHTMPDINLEITDQDFQFDMEPEDYMFLPYINYTVPLSLCILGVDKVPSKTLPNGDQYASLGQRALSSFPFYAVYDDATGSVELALGNSTDNEGKGALGVQIAISVAIVIILFVMLVYLIYLRRNRIKAEEWLEQHKNTLFSHAANLKTEEEILEALVKSKELQDLLEEKNRIGGGSVSGAQGRPIPGNQGSDDDDGKSHSSANSSDEDDKRNKLMP